VGEPAPQASGADRKAHRPAGGRKGGDEDMAKAPQQLGIGIHRHFTTPGVDPYDTLEWERRDSRIPNFKDGGDAFFQPGVEFPTSWSINATNIVAQKYFRGTLGTPEREWSLRQVIDRVADTITDWGVRDGYFVDKDESEAFRDELKYLLVHQRAAFNSPVWFNIGVKGVPQQGSACFILAVDDTMDGILNWYREEGIIFKGGSGAGINLSAIRSSVEHLTGGGTASGPVSFMRGADASAGTIKCLHAETPVVLGRGVFPISEARPGDDVLTRFGYRRVTGVHDNGMRPLVRVCTSLGDELRCTPEHRFRVRTSDGVQWKHASEITADDSLIVDLSAGHDGCRQALERISLRHHNERPIDLPEELDEAFACWSGWVYGDGSVTYSKDAKFVAVEIGDADPELADRYRALTSSIFGSGLRFFESRRKSDASRSIRFSSGPLIRFLEANGLRKEPRAELLRVPTVVQSSPRSVRAAFLAGLFEADGHIGNGYPQLSTVSGALARDVHRLLLSIGIPSTISRITDRRAALGRLPVHVVRIVGGEGVRRFAKQVGFLSERKQAALDAAVARKSASPYETQWHLPHVAGELAEVWTTTRDQRLRRALSPYCRVRRPRRLSLVRARALLEQFPGALGVTSLADFAYGDEFYATATVTPDGEGPTFDLTVDGVHEYLVQSIVTHNSGGKTRRAAKMVILNADHPDIEDFIWCKAIEERKARALRDAGFDMDLDGKDSHSIQYQNANNSVRVTDEFMQAVVDDGDWTLHAVKSGEPTKTMKARELMRQISESAWECADPGMQFDTTINRWHTASNTGRINASNPCSEYMHLDNSACNLASINLLKYLDADDNFDVDGYKHTIEVVFTAQEIIVGNADYPTEKIAETSRAFRQLGLGFANLGAMLMALGLPYDSDAGRAWAGAVTALMTGHAYATSAKTAARMGPFAGYAENEDPMLNVLRMHRVEAAKIDEELVPPELLSAAQRSWDEAVELGERFGVRNSQSSVIAPTGTIALMMDCDTTGIEPDLALTKAKKLVGGGTMYIVNQTIPRALQQLGYSADEAARITGYIDEHKSIVGAPGFKTEHLPVFACSMGDNTIHYMGHIRMMGAVQPFISGAISKTCNLPEDVTVEEVEQVHIESWRLGLKAVAIYRDNCKVAQPLATQKKTSERVTDAVGREVERIIETVIVQEPVRQKLPRTRTAKTFSFRVADCHGYVTVGEYENGRPGEIFLQVAKQGSTLAGIMDAFAISVSHGLQYGVPLEAFVEMFTNMRFEPAGMTDDPDIRFATSLVDYIFRRLAVEYIEPEKREAMGIMTVGERLQPTLPGVEESTLPSATSIDLPPEDRAPSAAPPSAAAARTPAPQTREREVVLCHVCGDMMQRAGSCYACPSCGSTSGCS
jgi:ribonucleoside-diphosphate reductase alpha chain